MEPTLFALTYWHWFALALVLLIAEMAGAAGYLLWVSLAGGTTGGILFLFPTLAWQWQMVLFSLLSVAVALWWHQHQKRNPATVDEPLLNRRSAQYIGRVFTLSDAIVNGRGKVRVDDSYWEVSADHDMPVGSRVKVVAVEHDQIFRVHAAN